MLKRVYDWVRRKVCMDVRYRDMPQRARSGVVHATQYYRVCCLLQVSRLVHSQSLCSCMRLALGGKVLVRMRLHLPICTHLE